MTTTTRTGLSTHHKALLATTINNLVDITFTITPEEISRACLNDATVWVEFTTGGRIAFPLQALAATMNEYESEGVAQPEEATPVVTRLAQDLKEGDIIILDGCLRKVLMNVRRVYQEQVWRSSVNVIDFRVVHAPANFKYRPFEGEAYSEAYWQHATDEMKRYSDATKWTVFIGSDRILALDIEQPEIEPDTDEYLKG